MKLILIFLQQVKHISQVAAATNLFTTGSMISFFCYETGTWTIASRMGGAADAVTGAFAFARNNNLVWASAHTNFRRT